MSFKSYNVCLIVIFVVEGNCKIITLGYLVLGVDVAFAVYGSNLDCSVSVFKLILPHLVAVLVVESATVSAKVRI